MHSEEKGGLTWVESRLEGLDNAPMHWGRGLPHPIRPSVWSTRPEYWAPQMHYPHSQIHGTARIIE